MKSQKFLLVLLAAMACFCKTSIEVGKRVALQINFLFLNYIKMNSNQLLTDEIDFICLNIAGVVDEENVEPQGHPQPIDPFCYGLCSTTFGHADCFALCKAKQFKDGNCIVQFLSPVICLYCSGDFPCPLQVSFLQYSGLLQLEPFLAFFNERLQCCCSRQKKTDTKTRLN